MAHITGKFYQGKLVPAEVICNNLGGFGPDDNVNEQLHYRAVARLHHRAVDVVRGEGKERLTRYKFMVKWGPIMS